MQECDGLSSMMGYLDIGARYLPLKALLEGEQGSVHCILQLHVLRVALLQKGLGIHLQSVQVELLGSMQTTIWAVFTLALHQKCSKMAGHPPRQRLCEGCLDATLSSHSRGTLRGRQSMQQLDLPMYGASSNKL